ncbi:MAG: MFS transporter [Paludibacteraceae bacterium]
MNFNSIINRIGNYTFRSFHHKNYRLYFYGQSVSLVGTWIQRIATPWLVYRLTDSALMLGVIGFASQIPTFIMSPFAGVIIDRVNKYKVMLVTQILLLIQAALLAILYLTGSIQIWHIIVLNLFQGIINAFDGPARQSFVIEMVEGKEDLPNAIALNSAMFNGARLVGPTVAGMLIAFTGEGVCFLINALSYLFVIVSLLRMKISHKEPELKEMDVIKNIKEGFSYTFHSVPIRAILLMLSLSSLTAMQYVVLMPVFSKEVLSGTSQTFGFLMAASGIGALLGTLVLASKNSVKGLEKLIPVAALVFGVGLIFFSLSSYFIVSFFLMFVLGAGMILQTASSNTLIQSIVEEDKRGRVMSIYTMAFMGTAPFGALFTGWLAKQINVSNTLIICGAITILGALVYLHYLPGIKNAVKDVPAFK